MAQRLPHVTQEMPYLAQVGESYAVSGTSWRGKKLSDGDGVSPSFFGGEDEDSIYLICCYRTANSVIAICIRAKAQAFEEQRGVFRWLLEKVNLNEPLPEFDKNGEAKNFTHSRAVDCESSFDPAPGDVLFVFCWSPGSFTIYCVFIYGDLAAHGFNDGHGGCRSRVPR